ncbi:MAG: hypothetical protein AAF492_32880, partial [Verrucomicrobiota bacterium]
MQNTRTVTTGLLALVFAVGVASASEPKFTEDIGASGEEFNAAMKQFENMKREALEQQRRHTEQFERLVEQQRNQQRNFGNNQGNGGRASGSARSTARASANGYDVTVTSEDG